MRGALASRGGGAGRWRASGLELGRPRKDKWGFVLGACGGVRPVRLLFSKGAARVPGASFLVYRRMIPCVTTKRVDIPGGVWAPKVSGMFEEGDPASTHFFVTGKVDIKELAGHLKLFFEDVKIVKRKMLLTDKEKEELKAKYLTESAETDKKGLEEGTILEALSPEALKARDDAAIEEILKEAQAKKDIPIPSRLHVYLTRRKPKTKMSDAHKNGSRVHLRGDTDGLFGKPETIGTFAVPLKDIPDVLGYLGLVILKLPQDAPKTNDPVIYGLAKLQSARSVKVKTSSALHLTEISESLFKILAAAEPGAKTTSAEDSCKPLHYYSTMASKAWLSLQVPFDEEIEFETLAKMLDNVNVFLVDAQIRRLFHAVDVDGSGEMGMLEFENFLMAYDIIGSASADLSALDIYETLKFYPDGNDEFGNHEGMDFSGFLEAIEMLGTDKNATHEDVVRAFATAAGVKESKVDSTYLSHEQFKRAWIKVADMEAEMKKRKLKYDSNLLAVARNRDRLYRIITDQEVAYHENLKKINEVVENIKRNRRQKSDERKRAANAHKESLLHAAHKFQAIRGQEKRLLQKQEAEEKQKKRFEERTLRAKLLQQQQESREKARKAILESRLEADKLRADEIRAQGLDRIDLSIQGLREIPSALYETVAAQSKLSYLVHVDMSRNMLDKFPDKNFCYWMTEVKRWKISQNRLRALPEEMGYMFKMEILEADSNKLESIPSEIGKMTALQRLDISNNHLTLLPESLGQCQSLRYFYAHSNNLQLLPASIGGCFRLEYIDVSRNRIRELPEDLGQLVSLVHLDLNTNRIGHLPRELGNSTKLSYLDVSTNILVFLPESFSKLKSLEICNLENNEMIMQPNRFNNCTSLQVLNMKRNQSMHINGDIGACKLMTKLDAANNKIQDIPVEIGLMTCIQEIDLSYNALTSLPVELGSCGMLQRLTLCHNLIEGSFPVTIGLVQSLRFLDFSFNKVNELPRSVIGLKQLETLRAERCLMAALPDTMIYLDKLELLDLSNNLFTRFPIELSAMKSLRILNLSNNSIPLLPRNINSMTNLHALDLKRNQLRALPVEFVQVFESVGEVLLDSNPWTDLPPRWGRLWSDKKAVDGPRGYALTEAVDFLYGMQAFYDAADDIWKDLGVFHYTNRLGFSDFLDELKKRIPKTWHDGLIEYVKHVYFSARQSGVFPRWYSLEGHDDFLAERALMKAADAKRRDLNVQRSRADAKERADRMAAVYDVEPLKRAHKDESIAQEHAVNEQVLQKMALAALHHCVTERERKNEEKASRQDQQQQRIVKAETDRLMEIVEADRRSRIRAEEAAARAAKKAQKKSKRAAQN